MSPCPACAPVFGVFTWHVVQLSFRPPSSWQSTQSYIGGECAMTPSFAAWHFAHGHPLSLCAVWLYVTAARPSTGAAAAGAGWHGLQSGFLSASPVGRGLAPKSLWHGWQAA